MIEKLKNNKPVYLNYGYTEFKLPQREDINRKNDTEVFERLYTTLYTDGEISKYESYAPGVIGGFKLKRENYDDINLLKTDEVYIKNHNFVIAETKVFEWEKYSSGSISFMPVVKKRKIYLNESNSLKSLIKTIIVFGNITLFKNTHLCRYNILPIEENSRVRVLKMK